MTPVGRVHRRAGRAAGRGGAPPGTANCSRLISEHTGFFVEVGREAGEQQYGFLHRSFAEYLAALELAEAWDEGSLDLAAYLHVDRWEHVVGFLIGHIGLRGPAAATRLVEAILDAEPPSERYLRRNATFVVSHLAKGLEVRPALRDEVVRRSFADVLDPALEVFRTWRGLALADLGAAHATGRGGGRLDGEARGCPGRAARKHWLGTLIWPDSDDRVGALLQALDSLADGALEVDADIDCAFRAIGIPATEPVEGPALFARDTWYSIDPEVAERVTRVGVPTLTVGDLVVAATTDALPRILLFDPESLGAASIGELVALLSGDSDLLTVAYAVVADTHWHDQRASDIRVLCESSSSLPPPVASYALAAVNALDAGPGRDAWMAVLVALIIGGNTTTRQYALVEYLTSEYGSRPESAELVRHAIDDDAVSARALAMATAHHLREPDPAIVDIAESIMREHPDPVARGLARRALALAPSVTDPLKILSSPDVVVPAEAIVDPVRDTTCDVIAALFLVEGAERQQAAARIARAIIEVGTYEDYHLGAGELYSNPAFDRLGRELARSPRSEARCWAARMLESVVRGPAPEELRLLLADPDQIVRAAARDAIQEVDLADTGWLEEAIVEWFAVENSYEAGDLPGNARVHRLARDDG